MPGIRIRPVHYLDGLLMGTADAIPGVSGGTMALIVGIYERLLGSIESGFRAAVSVVRLRPAEVRTNLGRVEWRLIVPLFAGIITALLVAARFMPQLLERYPTQSRALFLGMVAASVSIPWKRIAQPAVGHVLVAVPAAVAGFVLTGLPPGTVSDPSPLQIFGAAAIAICAMILPGISGAFLLLAAGMYEPTLRAVDERDLGYIAIFVLGAGVGLGSFSILLNRLLERRHDTTMAALVGLMLGSLRALWPWQDVDRELLTPHSSEWILPVLLGVVGLVLVLGVERLSHQGHDG